MNAIQGAETHGSVPIGQPAAFASALPSDELGTACDPSAGAESASNRAPEESCLKQIGNAIVDGAKQFGKFLKDYFIDSVAKAYKDHGLGRAALLVLGRVLTVAAIAGAIACPIAGATILGIYGGSLAAGSVLSGISTFGASLAGTGLGVCLGALAGGFANLCVTGLAQFCTYFGTEGEESIPYEGILKVTCFTTFATAYVGAVMYDIGSWALLLAGLTKAK